MPTSTMPAIAAAPTPRINPFTRISSIDFLRGLVMLIMAIDHVRDYFHGDAMMFDPTDLTQTNPALFMTRWITHFCAPVFVFLAGTSAFMMSQRKTKAQLSRFLVTRGLWLIVLELTVVNFSWFFDVHFTSIYFVVIWVLGLAMVILAALIRLPFNLLLTMGLLIVFGHNLLDGVHVPGNGIGSILWAELHERRKFLIGSHEIGTAYPILPWLGIMITGYCFGQFYRKDFNAALRRKYLQYIGLAACALFIIIRGVNVYGDLAPWEVQANPLFTILSFLDATKYPPSLLYTLMTLGPAILLLSVTENANGRIASAITRIGRVPMFFYILHIYLIHLGAMLAISLTGGSWRDMLLTGWPWTQPQLKGYGFSLGATYLIWLGLIMLLYPLCEWYDRYKAAHKDNRWLSYL